MEPLAGNTLRLKRMGIDTHEEPIVYMRADCHVCRSEGFSAHSRITVTTERASIIATLNVVRDGFVLPTEAGLSDAAWQLLDATPGQTAFLSHPKPVESLELSTVSPPTVSVQTPAPPGCDIATRSTSGVPSDARIAHAEVLLANDERRISTAGVAPVSVAKV